MHVHVIVKYKESCNGATDKESTADKRDASTYNRQSKSYFVKRMLLIYFIFNMQFYMESKYMKNTNS